MGELEAAAALPQAAVKQAQSAQSPAEAAFWLVAAALLFALGLAGFLAYKKATQPAPSGVTLEQIKALLDQARPPTGAPSAPSDSQQMKTLLVRALALLEAAPKQIKEAAEEASERIAKGEIHNARLLLEASAAQLSEAAARTREKGATNGRKRTTGTG